MGIKIFGSMGPARENSINITPEPTNYFPKYFPLLIS